MATYLDHAATTPALPEVVAVVAEEMARGGNASSLHAAGRRSRRVVEESRESIAEDLNCRPSEIVFTSGGTESDNIAIKGTWFARSADASQGSPRTLVVSGIEHHAVLDPVLHLVSDHGARVTWLEPSSDGVVTADSARRTIEQDPSGVALVSVMWANNEVGTVQPVAEIAALCREHGIPFHTDAVQALGHLPIDLAAVQADLVSFSGHKIGGPLGVGILVAGRDQRPVPLTHGGGQERQVRSGTLDTPAIAGLAVAVRHAVQGREQEAVRLAGLRDELIAGARRLVPDLEVSGAYTPGDVAGRLPGNAHLRVAGCDGDSLLYLLDAVGVECSTGSACQAGVPQPSHVLLAMGVPEADARGSLRLSLGHGSTEADVAAFLTALPGAVDRARRARSVTGRAG